MDNLPESLKIENQRLINCLNDIKENVKDIWEDSFIQHYTKHGIDHSERIIKVLGNLLENHTGLLNEYERFVLVSAVYLHDIGMQSPIYAGLEPKNQYTLDDLDIVRENHNETSAIMIKESIKIGSDLSLGLDACKNYVDLIATVSRCHRKCSINDLDDDSIAGENIKLKLLVALIRLGDELDLDFRRVNINNLKLREIPVESKFYWFSHHYIKSVDIKNGKIKLYFQFPEEYANQEPLINAFCDKIQESVRKQFLEVYDILDECGLRLYRDIMIEEWKFASEGILEAIPDDLLEYITENVIKTIKTSQKLSLETGIAWEVGDIPYSDDINVVKGLTTILKLMEKSNYLKAAEIIEKYRIFNMTPKEKMDFSITAGNCYYILGRFTESLNHYKDALNISQMGKIREIYDIVSFSTESSALGNIGNIYKDKGNLDEAFKYFNKSLKIDKKIGFSRGESTGLINIAQVHMAKGEWDKALRCIDKALLANPNDYKLGKANILGNKGAIYTYKGDLDGAISFYEESLDINRDIGYNLGEAACLENIGLINKNKGNLDEALKFLNLALEINQKSGYKKGEANNLANIGLICRAQNNLDSALQYWNKSLKICQKIV